MPKFNTEKVNTGKQETGVDTGAAYDAIEKGKERNGQQAAAGKEEQDKRKRQHRTQGRKGCHLDRANLSITPDNLEYIKVMSGVSGQSMSLFVNSIMDKSREENAETYKAAKAIIDKMQTLGGADNGR